MEPQNQKMQKLILIGDSAVGKTSLILRFACNDFEDSTMPTIGVDVRVKSIDLDGVTHKLTIWDTAGAERFSVLSGSYYRGAKGIIFVYDVTDRQSFDHVSKWLEQVNQYVTNPDIAFMLVGNKTDLPNRVVTAEEGLERARQYHMLFTETSAKTSLNVEHAFHELVYAIVARESGEEIESESVNKNKVDLRDSQDDQRYDGYCC